MPLCLFHGWRHCQSSHSCVMVKWRFTPKFPAEVSLLTWPLSHPTQQWSQRFEHQGLRHGEQVLDVPSSMRMLGKGQEDCHRVRTIALQLRRLKLWECLSQTESVSEVLVVTDSQECILQWLVLSSYCEQWRCLSSVSVFPACELLGVTCISLLSFTLSVVGV
jgi:hypothetical protein